MINWIDVNDRVPKLLQKVLFHWVCPGGNKNISMGYLCNEGWDIYLPYHSYKMHPKRLQVTHWAELPQFPRCEVPTRFAGEIIIDDPLNYPTVAEAVEQGQLNAKKFAEKFVNQNKDLLTRLADK